MQTYRQTVTIRNTLNASVDATLRAGSPERWTLAPQHIVLKPLQSLDVDLQLKVLRFAQKRKAVQQGQRDVFHISAPYFEQKWHATFFLAPDGITAAVPVPASHAAPQKQKQRRALNALADRKRASSDEYTGGPLRSSAAVVHDSAAETQGSKILSLEEIAASCECSAQEEYAIGTKRSVSIISPGSASFGDVNGDTIELHTSVDESSKCRCCCHDGSSYEVGVAQRTSQHRMQQLEDDLAAAQQKVEMLHHALADRDGVIR